MVIRMTMKRNRREEDSCLARLWYKWGTPYLQVFGWLFVAVPAIYAATVLTEKAQAFDGRLTAAEHNYMLLNQKMDTMLDYWGIPKRRGR